MIDMVEGPAIGPLNRENRWFYIINARHIRVPPRGFFRE